MPARRAINLAYGLTASWAIACGNPTPAPADQARKQAQRELDLGGRQFEVEDLGQAPRRQLSYAGAHARRVRISVSTRQPSAEREKVSPPFFVVELDWRGQAPLEGPATYEFAVKAAGAANIPKLSKDPDVAELLEKIETPCLRVRGSVRIEDGQLFQISSTRGPHLSPDIPILLDLFLVPLPKAEIGVGARWATTDAKANERREYVLTHLGETSATIDFERSSTEESPSRPLVRGRFELRSTGGTEAPKLVFSDPLPTRGELEFIFEIQYADKAGDSSTQIHQIIELDTPP